jgi:hypothetical protein
MADLDFGDQGTGFDLQTALPSVETPTPPPQLDYRANPSITGTDTQDTATFTRDQPLDRSETLMPPQRNLGHLGYSLSSMEAVPNLMTDDNTPLSFGNVPDAGYGQGPSIGQYDFWGNT